jgi:hypothetical protein
VDGSSLKPPARKDQHGPARWVPSALPGMSVIDCDARSKAEGPHPSPEISSSDRAGDHDQQGNQQLQTDTDTDTDRVDRLCVCVGGCGG